MSYLLFGRLNWIVFIFILCVFCSNLLQQQDTQVLQVCLDALHNILKQISGETLAAVVTEIEECGGLDKIENLQTHSNGDIYQQSYEIIDKFFSNGTVSGIKKQGKIFLMKFFFSRTMKTFHQWI
jgi:hypothetical protein